MPSTLSGPVPKLVLGWLGQKVSMKKVPRSKMPEKAKFPRVGSRVGQAR